MSPFRPLDEAGLQRLDDDALLEYMRRARRAGHASAATALAIMVYGHRSNVERRVRMKVPSEHVEDVTADIVAGAIVSAFHGDSVGQFRAWLDTITRRAIADFHRRGAGAVRIEELTADQPAPVAGTVELADAVGRVLATMRPEHRRVVERVVFGGLSASEVAGPGMSQANVHQIVRRFRVALRRELSAGGDTGSG
jgi:RNA polymerase sigma factor (sigma-70 family)